ncbi:hypothetical protein AVEN_252299-1 [Araneus ventricosus]|uniref:Uncharacterized protein n=1 Tax=Araneus ventricosus TaxID=182803 RepID=A0A4Y2DNY7_ARAVE|nr:hypothetical protein AVEN_252299-1 [Araneus ventricosus]
MWGRGCLVVRSRPRHRRIPCSKPDTTKDPLRMWACHTLNHAQGVKRPPVGMVWKFGEGFRLRCRPPHLTAVQNYKVRPKNSPRVASERDVNITKLSKWISFLCSQYQGTTKQS